ncbi:membrane bound O-acyl transferase family-domain-containing protein [Schizophyllum amplum]|uniref:Membrane bound O-acyl transferase family-domain-containing protein n=1 Tax=Schizophyllum amplum TaxID=97359 RepID=A0A550C8F9_9AGAR|nr:membrane bound O-acyl transferase family-domain-containing protein [Auriculariopsis ampla]
MGQWSILEHRLLEACTIPSPEDRIGLNWNTFLTVLWPASFCYGVMALLVTLPHTRILRTALLPLALAFYFRAGTTLDVTLDLPVSDYTKARLIHYNQGLLMTLFAMTCRTIAWAWPKTPYRRIDHPQSPRSLSRILYDGVDLAFNIRGIDWDWSAGLRLPPQTRTLSSRATFLRETIASALYHGFLLDALLTAIQALGFSSPEGASIFDLTLSPLPRYTRSTALTLLTGLTVWAGLQASYDVCTLVGVGALWQAPARWPPVFDRPWAATSVCAFWGVRWHQVLRDVFTSVGARPLTYGLSRVMGRKWGKTLGLVGAYVISGLLHDAGLWGQGRGHDAPRVVGFFVMSGGVGMLLEITVKRMTGRKVEGPIGWVWTMVWVTGWGHLVTEAWLSRGLAGCILIPEAVRPIPRILRLLYH